MKTDPHMRQARQVKQKLLHFRLFVQRVPYLTPAGVGEARALISALIAHSYLRDKARLHAMIDEFCKAQYARVEDAGPAELVAHRCRAIDLLAETLKWILDDSLFLPFHASGR